MPELTLEGTYGSLEDKNVELIDDHSSDKSWTDNTEDYLRKILEECKVQVSAHNDAGYTNKKSHARWAFPAMAIPAVSAPILGAFKDELWVAYFGMGSMCTTALCTAYSTFFRFGEKAQQHFNYAGRYGDIVTDIEEILAKPVGKRASGTVTMRTIRMKLDSLNLSAPEC